MRGFHSGKQAQGPTMNGQPLHMKNLQPVPFEQRFERGQAEIKNMLVVNRVELALLDKIGGVRELKDDSALRLEQRAQTRNKIIRVWRMSKNIVAQDQVCSATFCGQFLGQLL